MQRGIDIAYFIEMKEPARRIDPMKVISKGVPKGPFIGKLKSGESVTLADGRIVYPEDVFADGEVGIVRLKTLYIFPLQFRMIVNEL